MGSKFTDRLEAEASSEGAKQGNRQSPGTHAVLHHRDFVRPSRGRQAVSDEKDALPPRGGTRGARDSLNVVEDALLCVRVEGGRLWLQNRVGRNTQ